MDGSKEAAKDERLIRSALLAARARVIPAEYRRLGALAVLFEALREAVAVYAGQSDDGPHEDRRPRWAKAAAEHRAGITVANDDALVPFRVVQSMSHVVSRGELVFRRFARLIVDPDNLQDQDKKDWAVLCELARGTSVETVATKMITANAEKTLSAATRQIQRLKNNLLGRILTGVRHLLPPAETIRRAAA